MVSKAVVQTRIGKLFDRLRKEGRKGLVAYITAGDPDPAATPELVLALERGGADLIELGVPFTDPVADGPVILAASHRALRSGTTVKKVLDIARRIRASSKIPLLLFSYLNPLLSYGIPKLSQDAREAGIDGVLVTDLSVEEAGDMVPVFREAGLDTVFLAAPTSTERRLRLVAEYSSGFVYLVSRTGVTGEREELSEAAAPLARAMRRLTDLPLALGFGISKPEHVRQAGRLADAAVVGSAFVRVIEQYGRSSDLAERLEAQARYLKSGFEASDG